MTKITSPNDDVAIAEEIRSTWKQRRMMMWEFAGQPWGMRSALMIVLWYSEKIRDALFEGRTGTPNSDLQKKYIARVWKILGLKWWVLEVLKHLGASEGEIKVWNKAKQWYINSSVWDGTYGGIPKSLPSCGSHRRFDWY